MHNFRADVPMKLNALDHLLAKMMTYFDPALIMHSPNDFFFRISLLLFRRMLMKKTQSSYSAEKVSRQWK